MSYADARFASFLEPIVFSKLISYPIEVNGCRRSIKISRITPLTASFQLSFTTAENKMTLADAIVYLNTENNIK